MTACECGCGQDAGVWPRTDRRQGQQRGMSRRFIQGHNSKAAGLTAAQRFWAKVDASSATECWEWQGSRTRLGYGRFAITKTNITGAHRAVLLLSGVALPEGKYVCHRCDNPPCVNPAHLFIGDPVDNVDDMRSKGRSRSGVLQAARTACPKGHVYDETNTYLTARGGRSCRACSRLRAASKRLEVSA